MDHVSRSPSSALLELNNSELYTLPTCPWIPIERIFLIWMMLLVALNMLSGRNNHIRISETTSKDDVDTVMFGDGLQYLP